MAANWWAKPLPPGWESKWDPNQNSSFFIDHSTKKTSWIDPRSPEGRHLVARAPQPQAYGGGGGGGGGGGAYPMQRMGTTACAKCRIAQVPSNPPGQMCANCMKPKCNLCNNTVVAKQGDVCSKCMLNARRNQDIAQETSFNSDPEPVRYVRVNEFLVKSIKKKYPKALEGHVRSALESNDNDEAAACTDLERRGYKKVTEVEVKAEALLLKLKPQYPTAGDLLKTTIISCGADTSKTMKRMRELGYLTHEEQQLKERDERARKAKQEAIARELCREFHGLSSEVVSMALESVNFDKAKAKVFLTSMTEVEAPRRETLPGPSTSGTAANAARNRTTVVPQPSAPKKATSKPAVPKQATPKPAVPKQKATVSKTDQRQRAAKTTAGTRPTQPALKSHKSKLAHGPNPSLPKGGQDSNLLKTYCEVNGPNAAFVCGPSGRVMGSQGSVGPDTSLVQGPMVNTRYQQLRCLVTAI